ncbi:anhydro-N-acetylmuramic acid kinase [Flavilitoribacter nigricans]|uniref:Anhydro-N-acetylmuramic acid kinase n=1 Tax=Flavilitoribacter nigricans (strain ATCC 23147 / DSM 23189 / NBRC 102662 / NCIMB 1420 / SS-2) TaxID=1122177 RepID=A0A2D0MX96_FLAN2|nr:anhydro-N-acetylmuramic acid kinase [Flavilitoribacter nigricans]PHN00837.1 anhydro-N-acetylmuramic acid kinase [Flavilitoribacter nigricans DSM 23189 = NBRC 102662]
MAISDQATQQLRAIGLMSGSSLDGLDVAACEFTIATDSGSPRILSWEMGASATLPYSESWAQRLREATQLNGLELTALHADYGKLVGELVRDFLQEHHFQPDLIASHGHTVFHYPERGFTLQIGDGAAIAAQSGITTICDFRSLDIANGGQGAPLAPLADALLLPPHDFYLNLGGIANITARTHNGHVAFDICGANQILNALVAPLQLPYDDKGHLARGGQFIPELARQQNQLKYFKLPYPKSLDNNWVRENQTQVFEAHPESTANRLHTACLLIAGQIAQQVQQIRKRETMDEGPYSLLVSGGGAYNDFLIECIQTALPDVKIELPDDRLIAFKEAALIALMGSLRLLGRPNCLSSVTGATYDVCGGAIHSGRS